MDEALADFVRERARFCCEYCLLPQAFCSTLFQLDHVIAEQHGGKTVASNLALAWLFCKLGEGLRTWPRTGLPCRL